MKDKHFYKFLMGCLLLLALMIVATFCHAQGPQIDILTRMRDAPKLCENAAAQAKFDSFEVAPIRLNGDVLTLEFSRGLDMMPEGFTMYGPICAAIFTEIDGQLFYIGKPVVIAPITMQDTQNDEYFLAMPEKCEYSTLSQFAMTSKLPLFFFLKEKNGNQCIVTARFDRNPKNWATPARPTWRQLHCTP